MNAKEAVQLANFFVTLTREKADKQESEPRLALARTVGVLEYAIGLALHNHEKFVKFVQSQVD